MCNEDVSARADIRSGQLQQEHRVSLRKEFLDGMSRAANTVSVVTTDGRGGRAGVTVSAMTSVSADDDRRPSLLVCIHSHSPVAEAIQKNGVFCVNLLREQQADVADRFAGRLKREQIDKFAGAQWTTLKTGSPVVRGALVSFDCELSASLRQGSHWIFIGAVTDVSSGGETKPLVYANRQYVAVAAPPQL